MTNRIAVCGSAGIGKSTLCQKLIGLTGYHLIPDFIDTILQEQGHQSWKDVHNPAEAIQIRRDALNRKCEQERQHQSFVADKSVVDYLAYWELNTAQYASELDRKWFIDHTRNHVKTYDLLLLLPWGRIPFDQIGRRFADAKHQFQVHSRITKWLLYLRAPFIPFEHLLDCLGESLRDLIGSHANLQNPSNSRQIGLLIGSFDPPTSGHMKCALNAKSLLVLQRFSARSARAIRPSTTRPS